MEIEISKVKPAKYNPRKISPQDFNNLKKSLKEYGCVRPLVINKKTGVLVSGHQTLNAAKEIGLTTLPYVYVDLDEEKEKKLNIALNKISGVWDYEKLNEIIRSLDNIELTGFSAKELAVIGDFQVGQGDEFDKELMKGEMKEERVPLSFYIPKNEYIRFHQYFGGTGNHDLVKLDNAMTLGKKKKIKFNGDLLQPLGEAKEEFKKFEKITIVNGNRNGNTIRNRNEK